MNKLGTIFLFFVTLLSVFVSLSTFLTEVDTPGQIFRILLLPTTLFLVLKLTNHLTSGTSVFDTQSGWSKLLIVYCLLVSTTFVIAGFMGSHTQQQFLSSLIFSPMVIYFFVLLWPKRLLAQGSAQSYRPTPPAPAVRLDEDKRDFLKMIGAAGISVLLLNLFSRRTPDFSFLTQQQPVSSGDPTTSTPGQSPTAGYYISEIDDSDTAYFGFTNSLGQWYIMREESSNTYRYTKGSKDFTSNWANRAMLKYDYFENVF